MADGIAAERTLPDGRVLIAYVRMFNTLLTVSSPESLKAGFWDDGW